MSESDKNVFWLDDPTIIYRDGRYLAIFPTGDMTRVEQLNAVTRLCLYFILILLLLGILDGWILLPIVVIIFVVIIYNVYLSDSEAPRREDFRDRRGVVDANFGEANGVGPRVTYEVQSGTYDSDGNLELGPRYGVHSQRDGLLDGRRTRRRRRRRRRPTAENPFMNPTILDYNVEDPPVACNSDDEEIKEQINQSFDQGLYMDVDDLFNVKNSQRIWYTVPTPSVPPDTVEFGKWLWGNQEVCKDNQEACLR